jgi:signal transduction histidine kinase
MHDAVAARMTPHYDPVLVVVSLLIAIMASYVALDLASRLSSERSAVRWVWWLGGSIAMGVGIWSMHFVGMLAFHLPVPMRFDGPLVLLSVFVAIAASALALFVASRPALPMMVLTASSLFMGAAISGMHYIGMAAMRLPAVVTWRPPLVVISVVIAVTASFVALLLAFRLRRTDGGVFRWTRLWAATVMGFAIVGMHYTGMAAAQFTAGAVEPAVGALSLHPGGLSIAVIGGTMLIFSVALAGAAFDERTRLLAREQHARLDAEAANRLKDEFLAALSHELRTPLNVMVGRAQMLQAVAPDLTKVKDMAETIARNGETLTRLVEDLLDVSRMRFGGVQVERVPVDLGALVEAVAAGIRPAADAKAIRLDVSTVPRVPRVIGDAVRLQQVIWNLIANAMKFTDAGGEIRIVLRSTGTHVDLTVSDTGQGIDPAFLPYVFDMFRQGAAAIGQTTSGLGIGLSIARRLVELHGGTVSARSPGVGQGATFTVSLPCQTSARVRGFSWTEQQQTV